MSKRAIVLCIDDEPAVLLTLALVLQGGGFNVLTATTADEGFQILAAEDVEVVLLDSGASHSNAASVAERMKTIRPNVRVFLHSGDYGAAKNVPAAVDGFIPKPEHPTKLLSKVSAALGLGSSIE